MNSQVPKLAVSAGLLLASLLLAGCGPSSRKGYRIENHEVALYTGWPASRSVVGLADPNSFAAINDEYGKDRAHVFYLARIIPNADPATFHYLASSFSKDKNTGYLMDQLISHDGPHFDIIPNPEETPSNVTAQGIAYARDSRLVYHGAQIMDGADPATFVFVPMFNGNFLTRDRHAVYFNDKPLDGADGTTFQRISAFHFKDKQHAWGLVVGIATAWHLIPQADVSTFSSAGVYHAKDQQRVYFSDYAVDGADPVTFKETEYLQGKDKNGRYSSGYLLKP